MCRSAFTPQDDTDGAWFNYTDYEHNALRLFRLAVNADVRVTDQISVLAEIRSENGDGRQAVCPIRARSSMA